MLRFQSALGLISSALVFFGCGTAFEVSRGNQAVKGIPFFVKAAVCEHSTAYVFPFYVITYQTLSNRKVQTSESVTISEADYTNSNDVKRLLEILRKKDVLPAGDIRLANDAWNQIKKTNNLDPYKNVAGATGPDPVANTSTVKELVDYGTLYTLNARVPLAGSVNTTYKLNPDGTLSEGSSQIEDKTFETVLNFLSDTLKTASASGIKALDGGSPSLQGTVEKRALKITYSKIEPFSLGCKISTALPPNKNSSFVIEEIVPKDNGQNDDSKPKENEINFSGTITLPEKGVGAGSGATPTAKESSTPNPPAKKPSSTAPKTPIKK